jgi:hypothetical protein
VKPILPIVVAGLACVVPSPASAGRLGTDVPSHCVAHTSLGGGPDLPDDYRCAGLAIDYHAAGVGRAQVRSWAGQWLFIDETGQYRVGSCTFNLGTHPNVTDPSHPVEQAFPNDPTGALGAYLTWRYGDTTDALTAAAMWVVLHFYAQDAGGSSFADPGSAPLVPSLSRVAAASGRSDLQQRAVDLHAEAQRFAGSWTLEASVTGDGAVTIAVRSGDEPVAGHPVTVDAGDTTVVLITGDDGTATVELPVAPGLLAITASAESPGPLVVYRGTPVGPDSNGAQTLATAGDPVVLHATTEVDIPFPPPPPSSEPPPTTIVDAAPPVPEEVVPSTTVPPTTVPPTTVPATTVPATTVPAAPLPVAGGSPSLPAHLATALTVAGIGLAGSVRRRTP